MPTTSGRPRRSAWWWLAVTSSLAYGAVMLTYLAVRALAPGWPQLFVLLSYAGPFLFSPLALLLPVALVGRSRLALAVVLAMLALFLAIYLPYFLPRPGRPPPASGPQVRVLAFNLGPGRSTPPEVVRAIAAAGADIVAVEELTPPVADLLRQELGSRYPYTALEPEESDTGLLSRYPILATERFHPAGFGRGALQATLDVEGVRTQVIVIHPQPPGISRGPGGLLPIGVSDAMLRRQIAAVAQRAEALSPPVLILGDFNMSDQSQAYQVMAAHWVDAFRQAGSGLGFTFADGLPVGRFRTRPLVRIDYIFHSPGVYARRADVVCGTGSDHCYVIADLALGS